LNNKHVILTDVEILQEIYITCMKIFRYSQWDWTIVLGASLSSRHQEDLKICRDTHIIKNNTQEYNKTPNLKAAISETQ